MYRNREGSKQLKAEILNCIKTDGELTGYQVITKLQGPSTSIRRYLANMVDAGQLQARKKNRAICYRIPTRDLQ